MSNLRNLTLLVLAGLNLAPLSSAQSATPYAVSTVAGSGALGDGGPATAALLEFPQSVAADASGNVYIGDYGNERIRVVSANGTITTLTEGTAVSMKIDSTGTIYASDGMAQVFKILPNGNLVTIAGSSPGYTGDNGPATAATLNAPRGVAVDTMGDVFIADYLNCVIRKITPDGKIHTIAGTGVAKFGGESIAATSSPLAYPFGVEVDAAGNVYIAEEYRIRKVDVNGIITTIAGNGNTPNDGRAINSAIGALVALAMDQSSNLYLADSSYNMVRMISPAGNITTLAGSQSPGFAGDGSYGYRALLNGPIGVSVDAKGNVYVADELNQRIREVNTLGIISTVAGTTHYSGDGGPATAALLFRPEHAVPDGAGNLYISDTANHAIRKVDAKGNITSVAGNGNCNYGGDLGPAVSASVCFPEALAFDASSNLYIADSGNCVVRRIDTKGIITTVAGNGTCADTAASGTATNVSFLDPFGLAFDSNGFLYVSDDFSNRVTVILLGQSSGVPAIRLFAGNGNAGSNGDGGLSSSAGLNAPTHVAAGPDGAIYISDSGNNRVRKVVPASPGNPGIVNTVSLQGKGFTFIQPEGLVVDAANNLYVAWETSDVVTKTTAAGFTSILAGTGADGLGGDGGLATNAVFSGPAGLSIDTSGNFYVADFFNSRIRKLALDTLTGMTIASGDGQSGDTGATLPVPLVVGLTFQGGVGVPGIPVTFAVASGSATLSLLTTSTDGQGMAGVAVTLGNTPGPVVVTASTAGIPSVQFHLAAISAVPVPTITAGGVIGAGASTPPVTQISPGGFATVFGTNFAPAGTFAQAPAGAWPTQLGGACVNVNGVAAYVTFASPTQINFQVPAIPVNTSVDVEVLSNCGASNQLQSAAQSVSALAATPEFLYWIKNANGIDPVVAVDAITGAYIGAAGLIPGAIFTPAKPGEILTIYGVSFGPTDPAAVPGTPPTGAAKSIYTASVTLGTLTLDATAVYYAGVSPGTAGLYQLNIQIPTTIADGDYPLVLTLGSFATPAGGFISVKN
jgi:trimeric autotransporter adhesin